VTCATLLFLPMQTAREEMMEGLNLLKDRKEREESNSFPLRSL